MTFRSVQALTRLPSDRQLKLLIKDGLLISHLVAMNGVPLTKKFKPLLLILKKQVALGRNKSDRLAILRVSKQETCSRDWRRKLVFVEMVYRK